MPNDTHRLDTNIDTHPDVRAIMLYLFNNIFNSSSSKSFSSPPPIIPSQDPNYFGSGSPNMKLLYSLCQWAYNPSSLIHSSRLISRLKLEQLAHGNIEPLSTSHCQLWLGIMGACLYLSEPNRFNNTTINSISLEWLKVEFSIYSLCEHPIIGPWTPGARGFVKTSQGKKPDGANPTRKLFMEGVRTGKIKKGKPNQYDLGAWIITLLSQSVRNEIMTPTNSDSYPPIWGGYHARRFQDGSFYSYFDSLNGVMEPVLSAGYDGGKLNGGELWIEPKKDKGMDKVNNYHGSPVMSIDMIPAKTNSNGKLAGDNDKSDDKSDDKLNEEDD